MPQTVHTGSSAPGLAPVNSERFKATFSISLVSWVLDHFDIKSLFFLDNIWSTVYSRIKLNLFSLLLCPAVSGKLNLSALGGIFP